MVFEDGSCYIGSTEGRFKDRYKAHRSLMINGKHYNVNVQRKYDAFGLPEFEVIHLPDFDTIRKAEHAFIRMTDNCLNINKVDK